MGREKRMGTSENVSTPPAVMRWDEGGWGWVGEEE